MQIDDGHTKRFWFILIFIKKAWLHYYFIYHYITFASVGIKQVIYSSQKKKKKNPGQGKIFRVKVDTGTH